jgi:hypothetical protein
MRKARHIDISARLEATKRLGLLEDYRVDWDKPFGAPRVTVRGRRAYPAQITKNYIVDLLAELVPSRGIVVTRTRSGI